MPSDLPPDKRIRRWRAPGRVNIIGEHIDYLGGTVLPFACDLELTITSLPTDGHVEFGPQGAQAFAEGVAAALLEAGIGVLSRRGEVSSEIPIGAGLSSSAALEAALALALTDGEVDLDPALLRRAEFLATGVSGGVMDQTAVVKGRAGHAMVLDCATGMIQHIPLPDQVGFVVIDTGTRRQLADGRYAERRAEVEAGHPDRMRHAESEQRRVYDAVDALRAGDAAALGKLVHASHESLRDDFEVSSDELDAAVEQAMAVEGCHGARLVGGGFAGCVLAVCESRAAPRVRDAFQTAWAVSAVDGAGPA
jgi:galactokinase